MKGVHYQGILDQDQIGEQLVSFFDTFRGRFLSSNTEVFAFIVKFMHKAQFTIN